jgi:mannose-1-phosphate guanylyltransferase
MFQARTYLAELQRLEPEIANCCNKAISDGIPTPDFFQLAETFGACKAISIDYAVIERTEKAALVPVEMGWSDIGSWAALWDHFDKDANGNVVKGAVVQQITHGSYLHSEGPLIATLGVNDIVVVATRDAVLVCAKSAAQGVKKIVEHLEESGSYLPVSHPKTTYP